MLLAEGREGAVGKGKIWKNWVVAAAAAAAAAAVVVVVVVVLRRA